MRAERGPLRGLNRTVAVAAMAMVVAFVLFGALMTQTATAAFATIKEGVAHSLGWYYVGAVTFFLVFALWLMLGRHGDVRLGADDEKPEFGYFAWIAMLFSAGMGIGLVFWGIAEPIEHFQANPFVTRGETPEAAQAAIRLTFFHWGLHPWAIYAVVGLCLAYFGYRRGLPLTIRSALFPLFGQRIWGPIGHAADMLAVFATVFGVATSLGLGVTQMNAGLNHIAGVEVSRANQMLLIAGITAIATASVASGVERGVKLLSVLNVWLSVLMLAFLFALGPTRYLFETLLQSTGDYLQNLVRLSLWTDANQQRQWQTDWTTFYWGWWIAWAPFVGMFIARISRGRTVREFMIGVLLVPTAITFLWLAAFGGTALHLELFGPGGIVGAVEKDVTTALYATLDRIDAGWAGTIAATIATVLIATYFITSSDSGTLVVTMILAVGDSDPPLAHRIGWGVAEGAVAAVLLLAGGLAALQTAAITAALPFSAIMLLMAWGLARALRAETTGAPIARLHPRAGE